MDSNTSRVVSTSVVWLATSAMFVFGFFRFTVTGGAVYLWFVIGIAMALAPAIATQAIWKNKAEDKAGEKAPA